MKPLIALRLLPAEAQDPFSAMLQAKADIGKGFVVASAVYELALVAAIAGMMLQWRWGRMLGLVVTATTLVQARVLGPHVYTGAAFMLSYASIDARGAGLLDGGCAADAGGMRPTAA